MRQNFGADLTDEFRSIILEGREATRGLGVDGTVLFDHPDDGTGGRPEVQRAELRRMLLDSLPTDTVHWSHKVSDVRTLGEGQHELRFTNRTTIITNLLIGADGAWSRVRPLLTDAVPRYAGTSFVETFLFDADTRHPAQARAVGSGSMFAPGPDGQQLNAHREAGGTLHTYAELTRPLDWFSDIDSTNPAATTARIVQEFDGWSPELTALITNSDTDPVHRPHYALPIGLRWERIPGVTLLGDAAHIAPPDGEGANLAMQCQPSHAGRC